MITQLPDIAAVIFDMDGLLFDTERLAVEGWQRAGRAFGLPITAELVLRTVGRNTDDTRQILEQALGAQIDFPGLRQIRVQYAEDYVTRHGVPVKEGVCEILDVLTTCGMKCAVATSTERIHAEKLLAHANLLDQFDAIICGNDVTHSKPAPDIFLRAAAQLGVKPKQCAVLEDSASGIQAAANAGMLPWLVPDLVSPSAETLQLAAGVFVDLHEAAADVSNFLRNRTG